MSLLDRVQRQFFAMEDILFEKSGPYDFGGVVGPADLVTTYEASRAHSTSYQAVWCRNLRKLFDEVKKLGRPFDTFVDIGSGKGKAVLYADKLEICKHYIGVEFSGPLVETSNDNLQKSGRTNISFINADATDYMLPEAACIVFMFNPFDAAIMARFLETNRSHFERFGSVIAYANDQQRQTLTDFGFDTVFRDQLRKISLYDFRRKG